MKRLFLLFVCSFFVLHAASCPDFFLRSDGALLIENGKTGKRVMTCGNPDKQYHYASTFKLFTTAAALSVLGRDFHFSTAFSFSPESRVLTITSSGDPSMVVERLMLVADTLKKRGISHIKTVHINAPYWKGKIVREQAGVGKGGRAYQAVISPLSLDFNTVTISVTPTEIGKKPRVFFDVPAVNFVVENRAVTGKNPNARPTVTVLRGKNKTVVRITGTIGVNRSSPFVAYRKIYHPLIHYVRSLLFFMGQKNVPIEITSISEQIPPKQGDIVYVDKSRPLRDILTDMNRFSNNFIAESVAAAIGIAQSGQIEKGVDIITSFAKKKYGFSPNMINGSGLGNGEYNTATPTQILRLLHAEWRNHWNAVDFFATLPIYGETGTLHRVPATDSIGRIRAKTGTISGNSAASGIFLGQDGTVYLFTLILSDPHVRRLTVERNTVLAHLPLIVMNQ